MGISSIAIIKLLLFLCLVSCLLTQAAATSPSVGFTSPSSTQSENAGLISIELTRTVNTTIETSVTVNTSGTATLDTDYVVSGSLVVTFAANDPTNKTIKLYIVNDQAVESNLSETIVLTITPKAGVTLTTKVHTITITDDDVNITCQNVKVNESDSTATVQITRDGSTAALGETNVIECFTKDDSAKQPSDYTTKTSSFTFTSTQTAQSMEIKITNDTVLELEESFNVSCISSDIRVNIQASCKDAIITIEDDDTDRPTVSFKTPSSTENEDAGMVSIELERTAVTNVETTVTITTRGTATSSDYTVSRSMDVTFPAHDLTVKNIMLSILNDKVVESNKTIILVIQPKAGVALGTYPNHTVTITDDDVNIKCQNVKVNESDSTATVRITRNGSTAALGKTNVIECFTKDDSAKQPSDYTTKGSLFTFTSTQTAKSMEIKITNDTIVEDEETFNVRCYSSDIRVNILPSCKDVVVTIEDDDTYIYFCPGYLTAIRESAGNYTVNLCRVGVIGASHTVELCRTTDGTGSPPGGASVTAGCETITFAPGDTTKSPTITVTNDSDGEQEFKTFVISIKNIDPAVTFNDTTNYTVSLQDDDNTFYLNDISELTRTEGAATVNVTVTIKRVGELSVTSSVNLTLVFPGNNDSAINADCSGASSRTIQFGQNETSKTVTACVVVDDLRLVENKETFKVKISGVGSSNVKANESEKTIKLISNDVLIRCEGASLKEADGPANVTFNRTGATAITANNISCTTSNDTALSAGDYTSQTSAVVSFALNELTSKFAVTIKDDRIVEANESFTVDCNSTDPRVKIDASCSGVVINIINDDTYVFFCPGYKTSIEETAGFYTVRLCREGVLEDIHTVVLCRTSDAVSLPNDYPSVNAKCDNITFTAYEEIKEHNIVVNNDTWGEQEYKIFNISINTNDPGVTFNDTTSYNVTIHDDDNSFCFTKTSPKVYEESDGYVILTIRRTGAISVSNASVIINTFPQTAETPEDYAEPIINKNLTFFVGEVEKNVSVRIVNDILVEDDQTFQLSLTGYSGSTVFQNCKTATVTIVSNDVNIFCRDRRGFQSVKENKGPVLMEFTREGSIQYNHTMRIRTIDGTARSGIDFIGIDKTLTFAPYQTNIKENVTFVDDPMVESDETFRLSVTSSDDRVHMICPGTIFTILNDDTFVRCANQNIEVIEGKKMVNFTLKREGFLDAVTPIWYSTVDGTAFAKSDYKPQNKINKTFVPGQAYMTLTFDIVDDDYNEENEAFYVKIGSYIPTTLTSGGNCTMIVVNDDDPNRMTEKQAQELLAKRRNFLVMFGVAGAFIALVVISFVACVCYILRRSSKL